MFDLPENVKVRTKITLQSEKQYSRAKMFGNALLCYLSESKGQLAQVVATCRPRRTACRYFVDFEQHAPTILFRIGNMVMGNVGVYYIYAFVDLQQQGDNDLSLLYSQHFGAWSPV